MTENIILSTDLKLCECGCGKSCRNRFVNGHNKGHFKNGVRMNGEYVEVLIGLRKYELEHRLVYKHYLKILFDEDIEIPKGVDIHHIDGNKKNNSLVNLIPLWHEEHVSFHFTKDMSTRICFICNSNNSLIRNNGYTQWYYYKGDKTKFICNRCYCVQN